MSDYAIIHQGKAITPNGSTVAASDADARNAVISAQAMAEWQTRPERFTGYFDFPGEAPAGRPYRPGFSPILTDAKLTLWTGEYLGAIVHATVYRHNFGARMVSLRVKGTNGATYYGRASWDNGNVIHLRRVDGRKVKA